MYMPGPVQRLQSRGGRTQTYKLSSGVGRKSEHDPSTPFERTELFNVGLPPGQKCLGESVHVVVITGPLVAAKYTGTSFSMALMSCPWLALRRVTCFVG